MKNFSIKSVTSVLVALILVGGSISIAAASIGSSFPIEISSELHNLAIEVSTSSAANTANVSVINKSDQAISCIANFKSGPESSNAKRSNIEPQQKVVLTHRVKRKVTKMRITLECLPVKN